jgi:predicted glycogen debranching enzyme
VETNGFSPAEDREWLLANGLGGYASSTIAGLNTRKYHGLLVAAFSPEDRRAALSKIDEEISISGTSCQLGTNQYRDAVYPEGYRHLKSFSLNPQPFFVYEVPGARVEKTICMPRGENAVIVEYNIKPDRQAESVRFSADFLTTSRDHHWVLQDPFWDFTFKTYGTVAALTSGHERPLTIAIGISSGVLSRPPAGQDKIKGMFYRKELERGYPCTDDLFVGAHAESSFAGSKKIFAVCSADLSEKRAVEICKKILNAPSMYEEKERLRKAELVKRFSKMNGVAATDSIANLVMSSDDFLIRKASGAAIIAGYPWFGEWGRDSLISMPGLCLTTGRKDEAEDILLSLLAGAENGLVPNSFAGGKGFNSADASLWLVWAVWKYLRYTNDYDFVKKRIWLDLKKLMKAYSSRLDGDGLVKLESAAPMTWMDAAVDGNPVTLREGKPVEIQALWHNAMMVCAKLAEAFGDTTGPYLTLAAACKKSFNDKFVNRENGYLYDVVDERDASVRPNALFAVSLDFPVLDEPRWRRVVDIAAAQLLTPYGLRTLSPGDANYKGEAGRDQAERDRAYHQGDVWPWLMGAFVDAHAKAYPDDRVGDFIRPLLEGKNSACAGKICEVYDGDEPHRPAGCVSQAWSAAELMRVLAEHQDHL